ncbi:unnamed protein product, partial [Rotaria socialis]
MCIILIFYYVLLQTGHDELNTSFTRFYQTLNKTQILKIFIANFTSTATNGKYTATKYPIYNNTTITTGFSTTLDPAVLLVERPPLPSSIKNKTISSSLAVFVFHTKHHVLANLQLYLIRLLATDLVALYLFTDGKASKDMHKVAKEHDAEIFSFLPEQRSATAAPSDKNAEVVNWAVSTKAKRHLSEGTAILLLDGDVFPLSPFDSQTLLNSRDLMCRKHPALFSRF